MVLYLVFIYYKEQRRFKQKKKPTLYDGLLIMGVVCLLFDGITAYTVNHQSAVNETLNLVLHEFFLASVDALIFILFLYILDMTDGFPTGRVKRILLFAPFLINIAAVAINLDSLEYRQGKAGYYSMGIPAYTCYAMAGIYFILTMIIFFRRWNYIEKNKRANILTCLLVMACVTTYQMLVPDSLISAIGTMMLILGAYINQESPDIKELTVYHDEMVLGFATLIESRDNSTGGHVKRTTQYVRLLVNELRRRGYYKEILTKDYIKNLLNSAPMHDIGKIAVPDSILQKPGKLTPEEFDIMKLHTVKGGEIIKETFVRMGNDQYLEMAYQIARYHHEKWNGKGYPEGLKRKEIPLCARIMAIADVFDAVSTDRCYRAALPLDKCFYIIADGSGQDFDPILTEVFLDLKEDIRKIIESAV